MNANKKLGIIGGMGSRAGAVFFQKVIDYSPAIADQDFLEIILHNNSLIPDRTKAIVYNEVSPVPELIRSVKILEQNKVDAIFLSCITSHFFYELFSIHTKAIFIHPVKVAVEHVLKEYKQVKNVGLLATTGTIQSMLFHKEFSKHGIQVITLEPKDQEECFMKSIYMENGLKSSHISKDAKSLLLDCVYKMKELDVDLILGGCSELSIICDNDFSDRIPYLDVIDISALETVKYCYNINDVKANMALNK